jgi:hypothetical protein
VQVQEFNLGFRNSLTIRRREEERRKKKQSEQRIESDPGKVPSLLMLRSLLADKPGERLHITARRCSFSCPGKKKKYAVVKEMLVGCWDDAARGIVCMSCCRKYVRRVVRIVAWGIVCPAIKGKKKKSKESDVIWSKACQCGWLHTRLLCCRKYVR